VANNVKWFVTADSFHSNKQLCLLLCKKIEVTNLNAAENDTQKIIIMYIYLYIQTETYISLAVLI